MKVILIIFLAAFSFTSTAQYAISIVGSGDESKVRIVEYDDDITRTSLYKPMAETDAVFLKDSLTIVYDRINTSLDENLIHIDDMIIQLQEELKSFKKMKRKVERRIIIRDQQ